MDFKNPSPFNVRLESERVKLIPFERSRHVRLLVDARPPDSIWDLIPIGGPYKDEEHFTQAFWNPRIESRPANESCLFAVYDKTRTIDGVDEDQTSFAGMIGYLNTSFVNMCTEIGFIVILPAFQRTHVTSNAMGLLMQYALNLPDDPCMPGLGMRRLVWCATTVNNASINCAKRMGFHFEGVMRWAAVLPDIHAKGGNGKTLRKGDPKGKSVGRDTAVLSICWDDWETGLKEETAERMARGL